jgi:hypothetical protein
MIPPAQLPTFRRECFHASTDLIGLGLGEFVVREVSEAELDHYVDTMIRGWSLPPEQAVLDRETYLRALRASPRQAHFFAARVAAEIAGTAAVIVLGEHGYLGVLLVIQYLTAEREDGTLLRAKATPNGIRGYFVGKLVTVSGTVLAYLAILLIPGLLIVQGLDLGDIRSWV